MLKVSDVGQTASLSFADPAKIRAGDWVVAVGHPFGLEQTLTAGIISATDRSVGSVSDSFLQVNASMNPGDSGGPLLNLDGEVIGINSLVFRQGTSNVGIGFALSGAAGKPLIDQLAARGHVTRSWLGVTVQDITADLANSLGIKQDAGVVVADVWPNSPAAKAGIQRGDVIAAYEGEPVHSSRELSRRVAATEIGRSAQIDIARDGTPRKVSPRLVEKPPSPAIDGSLARGAASA